MFFSKKRHLRALQKARDSLRIYRFYSFGYQGQVDENIKLRQEIQHLKEVIACTSSRVIEIVEAEKKQQKDHKDGTN